MRVLVRAVIILLMLLMSACNIITPEEQTTQPIIKSTAIVTTNVTRSLNILDFNLGMSLTEWLKVINWEDFVYIFEPYAKDGKTSDLSLAHGKSVFRSVPEGVGFTFNEDEKLELVYAYKPIIFTEKGIFVGDTKEKIIEVYGQPNVIHEGTGRYEYKIKNGSLIFEIVEGKVYRWQLSEKPLAEILEDEVT